MSPEELKEREGHKCKHGHDGLHHPRCFERDYVEKHDLPVEVYDQFPQIDCEKAIIAFDPHVPYHDVELCNEMIAYAKKNRIKTLIIGGDFIDFKGLYKKEVQHTRIDWTEELEVACKFIEDIAKHFNQIWIIMGNHDWRLVRLLDSNERAGRLYSLIFSNPKVKFSKYQYCLINNWLYVSHSGNTKTKLSKAERIINVNRKSLLVGHSHRFAFGITDSGQEVVGEGLHLTRPDYHEYASLTLGDYSKWVAGWWVLNGNTVAPYIKHQRVMNV